MKTTSCGFLTSKFLLWITIHVLLVAFFQAVWGNPVFERDVVRGLCQAQCVSLGYFLKVEGLIQCLGPPALSVIPYNTDWLVDCRDDGRGPDFIECVGTCSLIKFKHRGYIPAKPEVSAFLDITTKNITLEWQPDTKVSPGTIYVVSVLEPKVLPHQWKQIAFIHGGFYTLGPVDDICLLPSFRVAAVNRFGSRWFSNETKIPANIPGQPRNIHVKSIDYNKVTAEMLFTLKWQPPLGWDINDIGTIHNFSTTIQCSADNWEKVYVMVDEFKAHTSTQQSPDDDHFTMKGRVSVNGIGCTIIFKISARSRCNRSWIGPAEEFHLAFRCSDIMQYKGEYCRNPPVLRPGPVSQLKLTLIPLMRGIMGLVSWQPPKDIGSAGKVEMYHIFYGIVDLKSSMLIKQFEGIPEHRSVSGDTYSVDIFLNVTTLESYETVGVMVRAAGPGQIIESPFGDIIYADNTDSLLHTKAAHVVSDDDTVIVIASSERQTEYKESGMGVEIFWRRPNEELVLDIVQYALEWGKVHSNDTSNLSDDVFDPATLTKIATNKNENFIRIENLSQASTYGIKILPLQEPSDPLDVPLELWSNLTVHIFNTPFISDESPSRNVATVPVIFVTSEKNQDKTTWIVLAVILTTIVIITLLGFLLYRKWHQRRIKSNSDANQEQSYRHYSLYGPGESLGAVASPPGPSRVLDEWELPVSSVKTGPMLGSGAFGKVVKGRVSKAVLEHRDVVMSHVQGGDLCLEPADKYHMTVAIKLLHDHCDSQHKQDFLKEIDLMKRIGHHRHVVSMLGCCTVRDPVCLVVEHMGNGDLLDYLKEIRHRLAMVSDLPGHYHNANLHHHTACDLLTFARQIALGMEFLSTKGYVHRDLAARNVLVDSRSQCKIGDFGLTRYMYDDQVYVNRKGGRLPVKWMSIEAIFDQSFSTASDVWSFGIVLFEIVTLGGTPYPTIPSRDLLKELQAGYRMERPDNCSEELYRMMIQCWKQEPKLRPSFKTLSDWLQDMLNDRSGMDYLVMGINLNRDVYQVEDKPEDDCIRFPLHRTKHNRPIIDGVRLVPNLEGTSDDSGYTTSKKSSVSSGESAGTGTPSMGGQISGPGERDLSREIADDDDGMQCERFGGGRIENTTRKEVFGLERDIKSKTMRKKVSFTEFDEFIEDNVFEESVVGPTIDSMFCRKRLNASNGKDKESKPKPQICIVFPNHDITSEDKSRATRYLSDPSLSDFGKKKEYDTTTKITCFCKSKIRSTGLSRRFSDSNLARCCRDDVSIKDTVNSFKSETCRLQTKPKTRRRKIAVVTAPTLALNNDLYFHLDTTRFKQKPPAINIRRKMNQHTSSTLLTGERRLNDSLSNFTGAESNTGRNLGKPCSFVFSTKAEVHNPDDSLSNPYREIIPKVEFKHLPRDSQQNPKRPRRRNDVKNYDLSRFVETKDKVTSTKREGDEELRDEITIDSDTNICRSMSTSTDRNTCLENICNQNLSTALIQDTLAVGRRKVIMSHNVNSQQREIIMSHNGDSQQREVITRHNVDSQQGEITINHNVDSQCKSPILTRKDFLKTQNRVRNDSGIPRSPDDTSDSPGSDVSRFFPSDSQHDLCFDSAHSDNGNEILSSTLPTLRATGLGDIGDHFDSWYPLDRTTSLKTTKSSSHRLDFGNYTGCVGGKHGGDCPALVSEKHPHSLYNITRTKEKAKVCMSSDL